MKQKYYQMFSIIVFILINILLVYTGIDTNAEETAAEETAAEESDIHETAEDEKEKESAFHDLPQSQIHTISWHSDMANKSGYEVNGKQLDMDPEDNALNEVKFVINFSIEEGEEPVMIEAGAIEIRIPAHIFYNRDNVPVGDFEIGVPKAPDQDTKTSFHYWPDDENDEIVITNHSSFTNAELFSCELKYYYTPSDIKNGYDKEIKATFSMADVFEYEDVLQVCLHTDASLNTVFKRALGKYEI